MLLYRRPLYPKGFSKSVAAAKAATKAAQASGSKQLPFEDVWSQYRPRFYRAQSGRCGFCETEVAGHSPHLEHFAPKAEVAELLEPGQELPDATNVRGRKLESLCKPGYWWRAYEWTNWLLACERCNTAWKKTLFPVMEDPRPLPPTRGNPGTPMLLHPYGPDDPVKHLVCDELGQIGPRGGSVKGKTTIETCGLDRESLRARRAFPATRALGYAAMALEAMKAGDAAEARRALEQLRQLGDVEASRPGVARAIAEYELGIDWSELDDLIASL